MHGSFERGRTWVLAHTAMEGEIHLHALLACLLLIEISDTGVGDATLQCTHYSVPSGVSRVAAYIVRTSSAHMMVNAFFLSRGLYRVETPANVWLESANPGKTMG